ncbi:MAG: MFS transporter [Chloroflexi bacterium]|nr:MFS transporter [Chloroflexota bacterium]
MIIAALSGFSWSLYATIDVYYHAATVGLNPLQLVLVGTTLEITVLLSETPTGVLADLISRRLSIIIGYVLYGIGFLIEGSFPSFVPLMLGTVFWGLGATFISGAEEAWIADEIIATNGPPLQPIFLRGTQWKKMGELLAIPFSIALAFIAVPIPILVSGLSHLVLAIFLAIFMPETGFQPTPRDARQPWRQLRAGISAVRLSPVLLFVLGIALFYGVYSEGFDRLWTKHLLDHFTLPIIGTLPIFIWWGILNGVSSLLSIFLAEFTRRQLTTGSHRVIWLMLSITLFISLGIFFYAQIRWLVFALLAYIFITVLRTLYIPLFTGWINGFIPSEVRATVISLIWQVDSVGQIAGGPPIGYVGLQVGTRWALSCSAILLLPATWLLARIRGKSPSPPILQQESQG